MAMATIRKVRGVPAKRGMRVFDKHKQQHGTITGSSGGYLRIRLDGNDFAFNYHPTWQLDYLASDGSVLKSCGK